MTFLDSNPRPSTRLNRGNLILANAAQVDTRRVRAHGSKPSSRSIGTTSRRRSP